MPVSSSPRSTEQVADSMTFKAAYKVAFVGALALLSTAIFAADDEFPGVKSLMSDAEFEASGLDKLDAEELEALDAWLIRYTVGEAPVLQESNEEVKEADKNYEVVARLGDGFTGWDGKTTFRLDNGQVWSQRLEGRYVYRGPANPEVRISRNWLGFYRMTLVDAKRSIGVSRVR